MSDSHSEENMEIDNDVGNSHEGVQFIEEPDSDHEIEP